MAKSFSQTEERPRTRIGVVPYFRRVAAGLARMRRTIGIVALHWIARLQAGAENHADYKFELYSETRDRIQVQTHSALFEQRIATDVSLKGALVYDAISGATPTGGPPPSTGAQVPTVEIDDVRRAGFIEPQFRIGRHTIAPQVAYSLEEDYESLGLSVNDVVQFNRRNTTLNLGVSHNFDRVGGFRLGNRVENKNVTDFLAGVTQVLTPSTLFNVTLTLGTASGYLSDPYKGFRFTGYPDPDALFPEKRPGHRTKQIVSSSLTQFVEPLNGSVELTYRFYHDSHGLFGHTATLEWFQSIGKRVVVAPLFRFYQQSEADFYRLSFDADPSDTENPPVVPIPQFYSADYRLSAFRSLTCGLGVTVKLGEQCFLDGAYKYYAMSGVDGTTPRSSYPKAHVYTVGLRLQF